jgi:type II secretory pathway pseudopilin PulG
MKSLLRLLLKSQHQRNRSRPDQTDKGMTLVELLVGAIMAFLIITPMLAFVVDMLNTDRREQVKTNTEQDIQAALDFIAQDLSQAIYIYDNNTINNPAGGTPGIRSQLPNNNPGDETPILVFWKRQQIRNAVSVNTVNRVAPKDCNNTQNCNDTYVRSLVAYYLVGGNTPSKWCQPSGRNCPSRIERYEIREGVRNPNSTNPNQPYYEGPAQVKPGQEVSAGFNPNFDLSQPRLNVTQGYRFPDPEVLVNYIDHTPLPPAQVPNGAKCQTLLGVTPPTGPGAPAFNANDLLITDTTSSLNSANSFYACVDTSRNLARVTIRGNSLRRLQPDNANYNPDKAAYFPTASVQVQGRGARGQ